MRELDSRRQGNPAGPLVGTAVLMVVAAGFMACQWGLREESAADGEQDGEDVDMIDGQEFDVSPDGEDGVDGEDGEPDAVPDGEDVADGADGEAGCTASWQCDDGDPCNGYEQCGDDGLCNAGTWLDDGTPCVTTEGVSGTCSGGACIPSDCGDGELNEGEECDDGNAVADDGCDPDCTFTCRTTIQCDDGEFCTDDRCLPGGTGMVCDHAFIGAACNDGDACTVHDRCMDGSCGGDDVSCDDADACTDDACDSSTGCTHAFNTAACDDGDVCTDGDVCDGSGQCEGATYVCTCTRDRDCDEHEDGNLCNGTYFCDTDGFCKIDPATIVTCDPSSDTECEANRCDPDTGSCSMMNEADGTACDDGSVCTEDDTCQDGACTAGAALSCDDRDACTADSCDPDDGCLHEPLSDTACEDGDLCTAPDRCSAGTCTSGPILSCSDGNDCTTDSCHPAYGCQHTNLSDTSCEDGNACTGPDTCVDGVCVPGAATCECTVDDDCAPYEDDDICNGTLMCDAGSCVVDTGTIVTCDPSMDTDCFVNTCDPDTGECSMQNVDDGTLCDDGNACTPMDICSDGQCIGSGVRNCSDDDDCTDDLCDPATGCYHEFNTAPCDDGFFCTLTDRCNGSGTCSGTGDTCEDGIACTSDSCDDTLNRCNHVVNAGFCLVGTQCVADGTENPANECQLCSHASNPNGWTNRTVGTACDDGQFCTLVDQCDASGTCAGSGATCDDNLACTTDSCSEMTDTCTNTQVANTCLIGGVCYSASDLNPANDCQHCYPPTSATAWTNRTAGTLCAGDGLACTADACNGSGGCISTADDLRCSPGDQCLPSCAVDTSGCVSPPGFLNLSCESPATIASGSDCTIDLDSTAGQAACLACTPKAGVVLVDYSDFGDDSGACDLDGWTLMGGNSCADNINGCVEGPARACCETFSTICSAMPGGFVLHTNQQTNCAPTGREEWRITKTFNTTGLTNMELCFEFGDRNATGNEVLLVLASDGTNGAQLYCSEGPPRADVDDVLYPVCRPLPAWAANNPSVTVTFVMHSDDDDDWLFLDTVSLRGWVSGCAPSTAAALNETFTGCGLTDWTVTGTPACPGAWNCSGAGLQATSETWTIEREVDALNLDGEVTLCFSYGDFLAVSPSSLLVEFNAQSGDGWQTAWNHAGDMGPDGTCRQVCVNLSDINPDVNRNPGVLIRFTVREEDGFAVSLDEIVMSGAVFCDAGSAVSLSEITDGGGGIYTFTAFDDAGVPLDAYVHCAWDSLDPPLEDQVPVRFIP